MRNRKLALAIGLAMAWAVLIAIIAFRPEPQRFTETLDAATPSGHRLGALNSSVYGYRTIQQDGASVPQRDTINFVGGATVTDDDANGVTIVTAGGSSAAVGWVTALDCDLTAQGGQTFSANHNYTVCGITVQKQNTLHTNGSDEVDAAALLPGLGLRFDPDNGSAWPTYQSCGGLGCTTVPRLWIPLTTLVPNIDWHTSFRVWVQIGAETNFNTGGTGAIIGIDDTNVQPDANTSTSGCVMLRGTDGTSWTGHSISTWCGFHSENSTTNRNALANLDASSANVVEMMEVDSLGAQQVFGVVAAAPAWPNNNAMNLVTFFLNPGGSISTASGTPVPGSITNYGVWLGATTYGTAPGYSVTYSHIRIDYRL